MARRLTQLHDVPGRRRPRSPGPFDAELGGLLAGALSPQQVIDVVVREAPGAAGADWALLYVLNFRLELELAGASVEAPLAAVDRHVGLDRRAPASGAARTGKPVWLASLRDMRRSYEELSEGSGACCFLPLGVSDRILGSLGFGFHRPRGFQAPERARLTALAELVAGSLHRARLFEAEQRMRRRAEDSLQRLARLHAVSAGLAGAWGPSEVAEVILRHGIAEFGAAAGALLAAAPGGDLEVLSEVGAATGPSPWSRIEHAHADEQRARPVAVIRDAGGTLAAVPLRLDAMKGALALHFPDARQLDEEDTAFLKALGLQCAHALDRALLYEQRSTEARLLQQYLLPPDLPPIDGLDVAARYRPFGDGSVVGGDFYDVFPLRPDRWGLVIGDVSGKGVRAATLTALTRYTIRAAASLGRSPASVLGTLNAAMLQEELDDRYCTVVHAQLKVAADRATVRMAVGGHPAPLVRRRGGAVHPVGRSGMAIGLIERPPLSEAETVLSRGDALVLYTDGFTEARSPNGDAADDLIVNVLANAGDVGAEDLAARLDEATQAFQHGRNRDDMALLVARVPPADDPN